MAGYLVTISNYVEGFGHDIVLGFIKALFNDDFIAFITVGLALWFIIYGCMVMLGKIEKPLNEFVIHVMLKAAIISVAFFIAGGGTFSSSSTEPVIFFDMIVNIPDDFSQLVMRAANHTSSSTDTITDVADTFIQSALNKSSEINASVLTGETFVDKQKSNLATAIDLAAISLGGLGGVVFIIAKLHCVLLGALAPIFILALLFKKTQKICMNWVSEIVGYILTIILATIALIISIAAADSYLAVIDINGNLKMQVALFVMVCTIGVIICRESRNLAKVLTGMLGGIHASAHDVQGGAQTQSSIMRSSSGTSNSGGGVGSAGGASGGIASRGAGSRNWRR
jgi:type IV secretion system protein VirB6